MVGQQIILFAKCKISKNIKNLSKFKIMTGFKGISGNKGAVALQFELYGRPMLFFNCHLESG